jgi:transposase
MSYRTVISDETWAIIEALLPSTDGQRGGRYHDHRPWKVLPGELDWVVAVDSTVVRTAQHAAGGAPPPPHGGRR